MIKLYVYLRTGTKREEVIAVSGICCVSVIARNYKATANSFRMYIQRYYYAIRSIMSRFRFLNITRVFVGGAPEIAHKRTINVSVIASFLSHLFTLILRHGYMPKALRDCLLIPIPKPNKDPSLSDN